MNYVPGLTSIVFPTTGRKERAVKCIARMLETADTPHHDVQVIVIADNGDRDSANAVQDPLHTSCLWNFEILMPRRRIGAVQAWNTGLKLARGEYITLSADDLDFQPGWLAAAHEAMRTLPDSWGMVGLNDGYWNGYTLTTHWMAHRRFLTDVLGGVLAIPSYEHTYFDYEVLERAKAAGRYVWAEAAVARHIHPDFRTRPADDNDKLKYAARERDRQVLERRRAAGFPNDYPPVPGFEPQAAGVPAAPEVPA